MFQETIDRIKMENLGHPVPHPVGRTRTYGRSAAAQRTKNDFFRGRWSVASEKKRSNAKPKKVGRKRTLFRAAVEKKYKKMFAADSHAPIAMNLQAVTFPKDSATDMNANPNESKRLERGKRPRKESA